MTAAASSRKKQEVEQSKYPLSACHNATCIRETIGLWTNNKHEEIGHVGLCGECFKVARDPVLFQFAPIAAYWQVWPLVKHRHGTRWNFDVKTSSDGSLKPYYEKG